MLNILILFAKDSDVEFQIGRKVLKVWRALLMRCWISWSAPQVLADHTPQVHKLVNLLDIFLLELNRVVVGVVYPHNLSFLCVDV